MLDQFALITAASFAASFATFFGACAGVAVGAPLVIRRVRKAWEKSKPAY